MRHEFGSGIRIDYIYTYIALYDYCIVMNIIDLFLIEY